VPFLCLFSRRCALLDERPQPLALVGIASHHVRVDAQGDGRIGVPELPRAVRALPGGPESVEQLPGSGASACSSAPSSDKMRTLSPPRIAVGATTCLRATRSPNGGADARVSPRRL
jgi:hypothetical protein